LYPDLKSKPPIAFVPALVHNYTEKASHGGITKADDIGYQRKGRPVGVAFKDNGLLLTLLSIEKNAYAFDS
jgi:hypothetical protein